MGEGGGQILRTSLALALCTGTAVRLRNLRARRRNPGLRAQHLAAVHAAVAISGARVTGAAVASQELSLEPGPVRAGYYEIDVGTAGSTTLVLQTILPPLSLCNEASEVLLQGGTHNPRAPTFEFIRDGYLPRLDRLGFKVTVALERHGFFPHGGGRLRARIEPFQHRRALELLERGPERDRSAHVLISGLPAHIGEREMRVLRDRLRLPERSCTIEAVTADGPGNALHVRLECANVTTVFAGFGMRGVPAETVAARVARAVELYVNANVAIDSYLTDQLLLPLALAGGGRFSALEPSSHTATNAQVIQEFLAIRCKMAKLASGGFAITLQPRALG